MHVLNIWKSKFYETRKIIFDSLNYVKKHLFLFKCRIQIHVELMILTNLWFSDFDKGTHTISVKVITLLSKLCRRMFTGNKSNRAVDTVVLMVLWFYIRILWISSFKYLHKYINPEAVNFKYQYLKGFNPIIQSLIVLIVT